MRDDWEEQDEEAPFAPAPDARREGDDARTDDAPQAVAKPTMVYANVDEFVRGFVIEGLSRPIDGQQRVWAAEWWKYPEAISRLDAMWRSWEHMRLDGATGLSAWYINHADPHMRVLMDPHGPFAGARVYADENKNRAGEPLPYTRPPDMW